MSEIKNCWTTRSVGRDNMADNNNQNGQDASQQIIDFIKSYKWRIIGFFAFFNYSNLIPNFRIWKTILVIVLCLIGNWCWVY